ncbi:TrbC/VirB2 family protein (plasmid) [Neorhizobium galegae]|nr:TrbC/VirB2 family protein [Neorhizobium galegae]
MVCAVSLILLVSQFEPAAAQNLDSLQNAADRLVQFFTGPFGRSVGAIAFIGMFLAAAFGYWSWGALLRVGGSLAGMFAAAESRRLPRWQWNLNHGWIRQHRRRWR